MTYPLQEHIEDGFLFSTDKAKLNISFIHAFLTETYWAKGIPIELVRQSIENSMAIGIYEGTKQVGFARVVSDFTTFAYLADVFVDPAYRGRALSKNLMRFILSMEYFSMLRRFLLATRDAHGLYSQFGFKPLAVPANFLEIHQPNVYQSNH